MATDQTPNYGLTRVGQDESLSKNGYAALDADRLTLDSLLRALEYHNHDASTRLANPTLAPSVTATTTGGLLPAGTTYYYKVSLVDQWGLETAASSEVSVTTPSAIAAGVAPALNGITTGGTLTAGEYQYVYTWETSDGGETTPSPSASLRLTEGSTNRIRLTLPTFPATVVAANIYRSKPGQSQYFLIGDASTTEFFDDGLTENYTISAPTANTTASTNAITISLAAWPSTAWEGVAAWRIYRATAAGGYTDRSLVHQVVETVAEGSNELISSYTDTGEYISYGVPRLTSSTVSGGAVIDLNSIEGSLPLTAIPRGSRVLTFGGPVSGTLFDGSSDVPSTYLPYNIRPVSFSLSAVGVSGRTADPINVTLASSGGASTIALSVNGDGGSYIKTWPLNDSIVTQAETATRSNTTSVLAVTDSAASSGMAIELNALDEYVQQQITLEPGDWTAKVRCRFTGSTGSDLRISVWAVAGPSTATSPLAQATFQAGTAASETTYTLVTPTFNFTVPTAGDYVVRVTKATSSSTTNLVDYFEVLTTVPTLPAGNLSIEYSTPAAGSIGTYHQYTVWF